jgi:RNA polymerase sigma factor (sigma-70 family)
MAGSIRYAPCGTCPWADKRSGHATMILSECEVRLSQQVDSTDLYLACRQDGSDAQLDAFQQLGSHLYRVAYAMLRDRSEGEALAHDCVQLALIKIHHNIEQCRAPERFREWAAQVARRVVLDELRRPERRRHIPLPDEEEHVPWLASTELLAGAADLESLLRLVLDDAPLSARSRRVVEGRYFEEQTDDLLAERETTLSGKSVLPSHIQVTRAKNLSVLRRDSALLARLRVMI